ncbi:MAG: hypothetical protein E7372_00080 [Clostridiales bacterium]|nr:hypothetical protein [Clostridiales bacterium]
MKRIYVSDITLKAICEQDFSLTFREKLGVAEKLDMLKMDAIELPTLKSDKECEIIYRTIAESLKNTVVKVSVGTTDAEFNLALNCIKNANKSCLQVILPVSTAQMEYFYHLKAPAMLEKIAVLVKKASQASADVEFVALDVFRADIDFVKDCIAIAQENGAKTITLCDGEGSAMPSEYENLIKAVRPICSSKLYVETKNNLSMAGASAVVAIKAGADGVKTSAFGSYLSTALFAEIIREKKFDLDCECAIDICNAKTTINAISDIILNKQIVVQNNIEAGIINSSASMSEISTLIKQLGYEISDSDVGSVYEEFKRLTAKKEVIDTKELEAIVASTAMQVPSTYHLVNYVVNSGNIIPATANITLEKDGQKFTGVSTGDGPIDAAFHAIEQIIGHHYELDDFQVHAVTKGRGAVGSSIIRLRADGKLYPGNGVSTDIVGACIRAYINALNKIVYEEN